jgi:hypothetical protein
MIRDPERSAAREKADADDLFDKLDSLIQKHQGRSARHPSEGAPVLTEPVEEMPAPGAEIPVLEDAVDPGAPAALGVPRLMAEKRRQLQVALYLRLRQRLDQELDAALADDRRLGAVPVHPVFTRAAQELRAMLPLVVRESVEQVFGLESLEALLAGPSQHDSADR